MIDYFEVAERNGFRGPDVGLGRAVHDTRPLARPRLHTARSAAGIEQLDGLELLKVAAHADLALAMLLAQYRDRIGEPGRPTGI